MSWLSKGLKKTENWVANRIPHTSEADRRAAMQATKEQIDYYQKAKQELENTKAEAEKQKSIERAKINEKEIRARQRQYRRGGFMPEQGSNLNAPANGLNEKLG